MGHSFVKYDERFIRLNDRAIEDAFYFMVERMHALDICSEVAEMLKSYFNQIEFCGPGMMEFQLKPKSGSDKAKKDLLVVIDAAIAKTISFGKFIPKEYFQLLGKSNFYVDNDVAIKYALDALNGIKSIVTSE